MTLAEQAGQHASATQLAVFHALNVAAIGDCVSARSLAARTSASIWPHERAQAALAFTLCGDTVLHALWVPLVRAAIALATNQPRDAVSELDRMGAYGRSIIWPGYSAARR
jgi:hypothetical protein